MATSITISGLTLAPSIQATGNLVIDQNAGTYRTRISDLMTYISSQSLSSITATSGTFTSISTGTLSASNDVTIAGNLIVGGNISDPIGNANIGSFGNIAGTITAPNQPYITTLSNVTIGNITSVSNITITANLFSKGITTVGGAILPTSNVAAINIGSSSVWFNNIYGTAVHALYADLAERYTSDAAYGPGTVVVFGTSTEVTASYQPNDARVAGVVSTNPAYTMNAGISGVDVALQGRVPCQVTGTVVRGDLMVTSTIPGVAMTNNNPAVGTVIGKALGNHTGSNVGVIEVVVGRV
jgi:hypothetical protein